MKGPAAYLAQSIEYVIEITQNLALSNFGDIVHGLACVVADAGVLVGKTSQDRRHDDLEILGQLLGEGQQKSGGEGRGACIRSQGQ